MDARSNQAQAVELLQELGLKEYEARSFVALCRQDRGTAKDVSETSDVPRTRVYDAVRVLEEKGLVETQHSNPQVFRAVHIDEAVDTLRTEYADRMESLRRSLEGLDPVGDDRSTDVTHEVWAISGDTAITSRAAQLIDDADAEVILVVGVETDEDRVAVREELPDGEVFVAGLRWLTRSDDPDDGTEISRLLMADHEAILVSSFTPSDAGRSHEHGVFGRGFDNGLVAIVRRLMTTGLSRDDHPTGSPT